MGNQRPPKDWVFIEERYRAGYSLRAICKMYKEAFANETLSPETVRRRALKYNWKKDLKPAIQKAVDRKLVERTGVRHPTHEAKQSTPRTDEEIVDEAAEAQTELILAHRESGQKMRGLVDTLSSELKDSPKQIVMRKVKGGGTVEIEVPLSIKERSQSIKDLTYALAKAVSIERISHNLDDRQLLGTGVIELHTSVPNPKPVPEGI